MLFLAVFCGFLAEYALEHKIERDREYQYMQGLIDDLAGDTSELDLKIKFINTCSNGLDSLLNNLYDTGNILKNTQTIYRQNYTYIRILSVNFNDHASAQLRHSGSLRLIRNDSTAHAITEYWNWITYFQSINEAMGRRTEEIFSAAAQIFNSKYWVRSVIDTIAG